MAAKIWQCLIFQDGGRRHLGFVMRVLDHPRITFDGLYHSAKFGWNRCSSFDNMHVLRFREFGLIAHVPSELKFTFAICYRPSVRLSVCCLLRSFTLLSWLKFRQCFVAVWYLSHPLTSIENFTEILQGEPLRWGRV